jgi:hypothetical protein
MNYFKEYYKDRNGKEIKLHDIVEYDYMNERKIGRITYIPPFEATVGVTIDNEDVINRNPNEIEIIKTGFKNWKASDKYLRAI